MEVRTQPVGPWPMNTYVLVDPTSGQSVLIDPGAEPTTLRQLLAGTTPLAILITHTHPDHIAALDEMRGELGIPVLAHPEARAAKPDRTLSGGDTFTVGQHTLHVYHTPGHSADMLTFLTGDDANGYTAIVGDTIFDGGPGRTWSAADFQTTLHTLRDMVLLWPDATTCHPGHGPAFKLGERRAAIEAFVQHEHGNFWGDATWDRV
ncbi:MAG: MBL fold metallo-hydrolase [Chloroflexaceae bacterium]|nr:MBL fold metallo-hydrolase [Chloroflexaceae bacterium]